MSERGDERGLRCLIVAADFSDAARVAERASEEYDLRVVMAPSVTAAQRLLGGAQFEVILADSDLSDGDALSLAPVDAETQAEFFLIGRSFSKAQLIDALRAGVRDVFETPLELDALMDRLGESVERLRQQRRTARRARRLRRLSSRIIRDRREVRKRVDLVCRDLAGAYRQLAEKVVTLERVRGE